MGLLAGAVVLLVLAAAGGTWAATREEETIEIASMEMTRTEVNDMIKDSMGVRSLDDVELRGQDDARAQLESTRDGTTKVFELTPRPVRWEYRDRQPIAAWAYEGQVPGPTITVDEGDTVRVKVTNRLPEATSVHWHGVDLPFGQDGVPGLTQDAIEPGETYTYEFPAKPAGTRFYHTHGPSMDDEARQLDMGLSGALIIRPTPPPAPRPGAKARPARAAGAPVDAGAATPDRDYPLLLDEWRVEDDGINAAMMSGGGHAAHNAGYNLFTINGRSAPATERLEVKKGDVVRLRFINGGTSTTHPMHLHGHQFTVTAIDGNPVPAAAQQQRNVITVSPGETYDVTFTANNPGIWMLHCHELHHADAGMMTQIRYQGVEPLASEKDDAEGDGH